MQYLTFLTTLLSTALPVLAHNSTSDSTTSTYTLIDDLTYSTFFSAFDFYTGEDPAKGFVQYQNLTSAIDKGLVGYLDDTKSVFMGVNYKDKQDEGRDAVRLESKKAWGRGLWVADIHHMPINECGVWPAYWFLGSDDEGKYDWPEQGEIDVLEGVNDYQTNSITLHTTKGCTIENTTQSSADSTAADMSPFAGLMSTSNCDVKAEGQPKNQGCSIKAPSSISEAHAGTGDSSEKIELPSYGAAFNKVGGGIYATEWTSTFISVWFIPRDSATYKEYFTGNATDTPEPAKWGTPLARFEGEGCDFVERFKNLKMIFNIAFCGEWAGDEKEWSKSCAAKTGSATCDAYVRDNPGAFEEAYWEVVGVKWYQQQNQTSKRGVEGLAYGEHGNGRYRRG